ncbi:MAG: DUF924 domain-containing protein [Rhodocyclales bacterium]|nr:DUF924 domain-containing protein [Rhodocyclales bacterium]
MAGAAATRTILDFWFLPPGSTGHGSYRPEWFRKDESFDAAIRKNFGREVEAALGSEAPADADHEELLARILLLDQFTRNIFRGTPSAFAGDAQALALATALVASGRDKNLDPWQRWFAYLPFEHTESLLEQERAVALFAALRREAQSKAFDSAYDYAVKHRDIVACFGRFPHRNAILGRSSTAEEIEFLKQPGSTF